MEAETNKNNVKETKKKGENTKTAEKTVSSPPTVITNSKTLVVKLENNVESKNKAVKSSAVKTNTVDASKEKNAETVKKVIVKQEEMESKEPEIIEINDDDEMPKVIKIKDEEKVKKAPKVIEVKVDKNVKEVVQMKELKNDDKVIDVSKVIDIQDDEKVKTLPNVIEIQDDENPKSVSKAVEVKDSKRDKEKPSKTKVKDDDKVKVHPDAVETKNKPSETKVKDDKVQGPNAVETKNNEKVKEQSSIIEIKDNDIKAKPKQDEEIEEEDVPGDFFDDFLKEDFMAGLDIVDEDDGDWDEDRIIREWKEDNKKANKKITPEVMEAIKQKKKERKKIDHVEKFRQSPPGNKIDTRISKKSNKRKKGEDELKKLDAELEEMRKTKVKRPERPKSDINADEFDIRRDPEKTKRDIQRDKVKCAKDQEKKIINEKLNIVETGLVPPGTEMEVDLEEIKRQEKIERNKPPGDLRDRLRSLRSRSKTPEKKRRSRSPIRERRRSRTPPRKISPPTSKIVTPPKRERERLLSPRKVNSPPKKVTPAPRKSRSPRRKRSSKLDDSRSTSQRSPTHTEKSISRREIEREEDLSVYRRPGRTPERTRERRSRSHGRRSPRRSRSRSPEFYRRQWERLSPPVHRRRRERSYSPVERRRRSRSRDRPLKIHEKRSFLEELAEKLNETRPPPQVVLHPQQIHPHPSHMNPPCPQMAPHPPQMHYNMPMQPQPIPPQHAPVPAPVPPPAVQTFFQPQPQPLALPGPPQYDPYDQSFFIGEPQPQPGFGGVQGPPVPMQNSQPISMPLSIKPPMSSPLSVRSLNTPTSGGPPTPTGSANSRMSANFGYQGSNAGHNASNAGHNASNAGQDVVTPRKEIAKLFQDKKIRLSEFLAITAKPEVHSTSPAKLQEKIKVIQRCQEAIKLLGTTEKKFTGRLIVRKTDLFKPCEAKNKSPLLRYPVVRLPFTTPLNKPPVETDFTKHCEELLKNLGIQKTLVVSKKEIDAVKIPVKEPVRVSAAPPPPPPLQQAHLPPKIAPIIPSPIIQQPVKTIPKLTQCYPKFTQTDAKLSECKECAKRKEKTFSNSGVQCGEAKLTFSVSSQCNESDFYSMIPKTQSLASLTPAQLLGKGKSMQETASSSGFIVSRNMTRAAENFSMSRYSPPSPPPMHYNPSLREERKGPPQPLFKANFAPNSMLRPTFQPAFRGNPNAPGGSRYGDYNNRY